MVKNGNWENKEERQQAVNKITNNRPKGFYFYEFLPQKEKEYIKKGAALYHRKHPEKAYNSNLKFQQNNTELVKIRNAKAREKEIKTGRKKARTWVELNLNYVLENKGSNCEHCDSINNIEVHHKRYTNNLGDLQVLCRTCHRKIHRKRDEKGNIKIGKESLWKRKQKKTKTINFETSEITPFTKTDKFLQKYFNTKEVLP